jgi:uncharacterized NAD(P)/FAD-binding protein YdhS
MSWREPVRIAVVGAGPRGTIMLDRICANAALLPVEVHVIDPYPPGGGRVWRTGQNRHVLMNTVAGDITVFTDDTVRCAGPVRPGPTQYRWAGMVASGEAGGLDDWAVAEARTLRPWSYPTRAFQGHYLGWALDHIVRTAPSGVRPVFHRTRAVALDDRPDGRQSLRLEGRAGPLTVDGVVLSMGHFDVTPTPAQQELGEFAARRGMTYLPPANPTEIDLGGIAAGEPVIVRGLGLTFFDYMALLTVGRGGRFTRAGGRLVYRPSGAEPVLYAGSGRGVPFTARAEVHREVVPRYRPRFLTAEVIKALRDRAGTGRLDFMADVWPWVARETAWVYYRHLLRGAALTRFEAEFPALPLGTPELDSLLADLVPDPARRWDWARLDRPADGMGFGSRREYSAWIRGRLRDDHEQARLGAAGSAVKATTAMLRDLRGEIRQVISHRGIGGTSYREHVDGWFSGLINYIASGPPASRIEELRALADAGVVRFVGPRMRVIADRSAGAFLACSPAVADEQVRAGALIEAHLPLTDLRRTTDPLLGHLLGRGMCRPHDIPDADGSLVQTGGLDITEGTHQVVGIDGVAHPGRFSYGPPVESVQWVTAIGARPHVNSGILLQADTIARAALATARAIAGGTVGAPADGGHVPVRLSA